MGYSSDQPNVLQKTIASAIMATVLLTSGPTVFRIVKNTPAPATVQNVFVLTGTGANPKGIAFNNQGQLTLSGSLKVQGVVIGTGSTSYVFGQGLSKTAGGLVTVNQVQTGSTEKLSVGLYDSGALVVSGLTTHSGTVTIKRKVGTATGNELVVDSRLLVADGTNKRIGVNKAAPSTALDILGTASASTLVSQTAVSPVNISLRIFGSGSTVGTGTGKAIFSIPLSMSGFSLSYVHAMVDTAGTTNALVINVKDVNKGKNFTPTACTIDSTKASSDVSGTPFVLANKTDVNAFDKIQVNINANQTTAPLGLVVTLTFRK